MNIQEKTAVVQTAVRNRTSLEELSDILSKATGGDNLPDTNGSRDLLNDIAEGRRVINQKKMNPDYYSPVELIPASTIKPKPIDWLIPELMPKGMITMLAGEGGIGKTYLALLMAALITNQGESFDGQPIQQGKVLIWSGEDAPEYTLIPRLKALGADLDNIDIIGNRAFDSGTVRPFDITVDLPLVEQTIQNWTNKEIPISLLIIDPVMSVVMGDPHKASHVRQSLEPLRILAERQNIAVLGITHYSKGSRNNAPQDRVIGSQAFVAFARMVLGLAKDEETGNRRLVILKSNITDTSVGYDFSYDFYKDDNGCQVARIELAGRLSGNARELLAEIEPEETETGATADAVAFLKGILQEKPLPSTEVFYQAKQAGHKESAIRTASHKLKGKVKGTGLCIEKSTSRNGQWIWSYHPV